MTNASLPDVPPNQNEHDVICHMDFDLRESAGRTDYDGRTYYFCNTGCKEQFERDPEAALQAESEYDHSVKAAPSMGAAIE